jgi:regulatory protein
MGSAEDTLAMFQKAKGSALRLLKLRPRSVKELRDRLLQKKYPADVVDKLIAELTSSELLDDEAFAKAWFQWRLTGRPVGLRRIALELKDKGITKEVIDGLIAGAKDDFDEEAVVRMIALKRMEQRAQKDVPLIKRKKRVLDYLLRRGFSPGVASKVIRDMKA